MTSYGSFKTDYKHWFNSVTIRTLILHFVCPSSSHIFNYSNRLMKVITLETTKKKKSNLIIFYVIYKMRIYSYVKKAFFIFSKNPILNGPYCLTFPYHVWFWTERGMYWILNDVCYFIPYFLHFFLWKTIFWVKILSDGNKCIEKNKTFTAIVQRRDHLLV